VIIPYGSYLPHGALVELFTLSWMVERWNLSSVSLLLSLFLKSIGENMIASIQALFLVCGSSPQLNKCFFSSYPLKGKYVELMGKKKGTTQVMYIAKLKDCSKRVNKNFSMIRKMFSTWYDGGGENGII
jgi:hypothetical protein